MDSANFNELEKKVNSLLGDYGTLKDENREFKERLKLKESEVGELKERVTKLEKEKGINREKIEGLISRIDGLIRTA